MEKHLPLNLHRRAICTRSKSNKLHGGLPRIAEHSKRCAWKTSRATSAKEASTAGMKSDTLELFSPAKINLFLRITKKREDGFHELASLFQTISLGDVMTISPLPATALEDQITCNDPTVPTDGRNLVIKAADLFRMKSGSTTKYMIDLRKAVPAGAGLGGGSGNAATMLWAANKLSGEQVDESDLLDWSGDIGSDISFFFSSGTAYCTGRGEIVKDMPAALPEDMQILLLKPPMPLSTGAVYKALDVKVCSDVDPDELLKRYYNEDVSTELSVNDLEKPAFSEMPILKKTKLDLIDEERYAAVFMSGSGSTMVCLGSHEISDNITESRKSWMIDRATPVYRKPGEWF